jgi:hypothetical protein
MSWAKHAFVVVQSSLKEYLHGCLFVARSGKPQRSRRESWFDAYQRISMTGSGLTGQNRLCSLS